MTVRLRDDVWEAISEYADVNGVSQQHIASVGGWLLMCMPPKLVRSINVAFYEWCKLHSKDAKWPAQVDPLLGSVIDFIHEECRKGEPRRMTIVELDRLTAEKAAEQALDEALSDHAEKDKKQHRGGTKGPGKGRKTG